MSGQSVIAINGEVKVTTPLKKTKIGLCQAISEIEVKSNEYTIPHANSGSPFVIPMNFSTGITEALVLILQSTTPLILVLTSSDTDAPGPIRVGLQGFHMETLYPEEGIVSISVINPDPVNDVDLTVSIGALGASTDQPPYWFPIQP